MNELLPINYDTEHPTVSARDLHEALGIEKRFSAWFETNSQGFIECEDFTSVLVGTEVQNNGGIQLRELQDYNLSIDMAKHICLMSRTEKGKRCRQYFIDLEKAWNTPEQIFARALKMADKQIESLKNINTTLRLESKVKDQQISEMKPKVSYYDLVLQCPGLLSTTEISKDYGMSAKAMNKLLHELRIQYCQDKVWFLYQQYAGYGYTQTKTYNYSDSDGVQRSRVHMYWTQKGRLFIYDTLKSEGIVPVIEKDKIA